MTNQQIEYIVLHERRKLSFGKWIWHYMLVIIFSFIPIQLIRALYKNMQGESTIRTMPELILFGLVFCTIAAYIAFLQYKSLRFEKIITQHNDEEIRKRVAEVAKDLNWYIVDAEKNYAKFTKFMGWTSRGYEVLIVISNSKLLVNILYESPIEIDLFHINPKKRAIKHLIKKMK